MKYLKLYESLEYFKEISQRELETTIFSIEQDIKGSDVVIAFTKEEIEYFNKITNKIGPKFYLSTIERKKLSDYKFESGSNDFVLIRIKQNNKKDTFDIYKTKDEWYYVEYVIDRNKCFSMLYYKCDQIEGVQKLIESKLNTISKLLESNDYKGYERIGIMDFSDLSSESGYSFLPIDTEEVTIIENKTKIKLLQRLCDPSIIDYDLSTYWNFNKEHGLIIRAKKSKVSIALIIKTMDEWYYILDYENYKAYKCDQIEGLVNCLADFLPNILSKII